MKAFFLNLCPNCNGRISDERLLAGSVCKNCLPKKVTGVNRIYLALKRSNKLKDYSKIYEIARFEEEFTEFFRKKIGEPFSVQLTWAKRVFMKKSFSILAPTGIGKTTFGIISSLFFDGKFYFIVPTSILVEEVSKRIEELNDTKRIVYYHSNMKKKEKDEVLDKIRKGDFDILVSTHMFLYKHYNEIPKVDYLFVDDVDSFLKQARNIDKALKLIGFSDRAIDLAMKIIDLKSKGNFELANKLEEKLKEYKKFHGIMVVSSATARPKSKRVHLFRELLDFEVGVSTSTLRNILDVYTKMDLIEIIKKYGSGVLVFVPSDKGKYYVNEVVKLLNSNGIKAESYESLSEELLKKFRNGEIDALVGISSYRNPLARGIDLPDRIRYVIFYGVPKFKIDLFENLTPMKALVFLSSIYDLVNEKTQLRIAKALKFLKKNFRLIPQIIDLINSISTDELFKKINESKDISIENGKLIVADVTGYVQASGRSSRMYFGGLSKGVAITIVDDEKALNRLKKKLFWNYGIELLEFDEKKVNSAFVEVDRDREKIKKAMEGEYIGGRNLVKTALMIVESPNKARVIANFFGKPLKRKFGRLTSYEVNIGNYILTIIATQGHVFDLVTKEGYHGVIIDEMIPIYDTIKYGKKGTFVDEYSEFDFDKSEVIKVLRELASEVDLVIVATDPDTEGEKIAWDVATAITPYSKKIVRAEFHEVTRKAILNAIENWRKVDDNLVNAQIVRRVVDRWVGFELSKKVQQRFRNSKLSAGRVQTPVLGFVIEKYFNSRKKVWELRVNVGGAAAKFRVEKKVNVEPVVKFVKKIIATEHPEPPFNTYEMIKEASKIGLSAKQTMDLAQDLFEAGLITYHRTDSHRVSVDGIRIAKEYILDKFGEEYFKASVWGKGGAHECIRPTRPIDVIELMKEVSLGNYELKKDHLRLYNLIFKRFIASQMRPIKSEKEIYEVYFMGEKQTVEVRKKIVEHGFDLIIHVGVSDSQIKFYWKRVPLEYPLTQGEIVSLMKEKGIGRPSTYAKIVDTLFERKYVKQVGKFVYPTKLGILVFNYLISKFKEFISVEFTAEVEELMDRVENGYSYKRILKFVLSKIETFFNPKILGSS